MKNKHILIMLLATALLLGTTACHKDAQIEPKTPEVTEPDVSFTATTADFGWAVSFPGKVSSVVKVSRHADMSDATSYGDATPTSNKGFHVAITGLSPETQYYYCFEIWNPNLNNRSEVKSFTTQPKQKPLVTTAPVTESQLDFTNATAVGGGEVTSDEGDPVTERGIYFGTSPNPAATGTKIVASSAGTGSFNCTMTGLVEGTTYYVCAYATNGQGTSCGNEKSFIYIRVPVGAIKGVFSVGSGKKVYFSQGNLQYQASTNTWRFATNQYDYIGDANSNISQTYSGWIDLFGWGTSGYHDSSDPYNVNYQPWSTSTAAVNETYNKYGYGPSTNMPSTNLTGSSAQYDWGVHNTISNTTGQWRTLTGGSSGEWVYIFNTRSASTVNGVSNARYAKAKVANAQGVILFPDSYVHPSGVAQPVGINETGNAGWNGNDYSASDFALMQTAGAVFLPAAGYRKGTSVYYVGSDGNYWSASYNGSYDACDVGFCDSNLGANSYPGLRYGGQSVRLVRVAEN